MVLAFPEFHNGADDGSILWIDSCELVTVLLPTAPIRRSTEASLTTLRVNVVAEDQKGAPNSLSKNWMNADSELQGVNNLQHRITKPNQDLQRHFSFKVFSIGKVSCQKAI